MRIIFRDEVDNESDIIHAHWDIKFIDNTYYARHFEKITKQEADEYKLKGKLVYKCSKTRFLRRTIITRIS